ncbi:MAG: hypothetical protein KIT35_16555 [Piscinibacter sp.]|uniref:primase 1D-like protein n=1 Tax=Piscinibacter sp. TaxID=1903157 RepID=UPI00258374B2|nr:hypothetical protein [Piscinibacter sp.]MCW5665445.1 hypothetical protein [Piscinibacter sp.]
MIPKSHPYWHVREVVERRSDIIALPLSYYTYVPQSVVDTRSTWLLPASEFLSAERVEALMAVTPAGQELAIHSDVSLVSGARAHLVMVDMATSAKAHLEKLSTFLRDNFSQQISWFSSGRSFHGYGSDLLAEQDWVKFMGLLLLANKPRLEPTVDPRWIGHRLLAGYAALRWTKNTSHYLVPPAAVETARTSGPASEVGPLGNRLRSNSGRP